MKGLKPVDASEVFIYVQCSLWLRSARQMCSRDGSCCAQGQPCASETCSRDDSCCAERQLHASKAMAAVHRGSCVPLVGQGVAGVTPALLHPVTGVRVEVEDAGAGAGGEAAGLGGPAGAGLQEVQLREGKEVQGQGKKRAERGEENVSTQGKDRSC